MTRSTDAHQDDSQHSPSAKSPRLIAMMNQKGGVGKTTTTVNLGAALAELGQRVLMIDLDPQSHLSLHLGCEVDETRPTIYDLLLDPDCNVREIVVTATDNIDLIPSEVDLAAAESELANQPGREAVLRNALPEVIVDYDVVLFDCPPSLGLLTLNALVVAKEVMIPMQAHFLPLQGVGRLLETVGMVRQSLNQQLQVTGIILCAFESNTTLAGEIVADLHDFFDESRETESAWQHCRILEPPIRRNIKLAEAPSFGRTIFDYAPWCPGAQDYRHLAENLLAHWEGRKPKRRPPKKPAKSESRHREPAEVEIVPTPPNTTTQKRAAAGKAQRESVEAPRDDIESAAPVAEQKLSKTSDVARAGDRTDHADDDSNLTSLIEEIESLDRAING